jgi:hypothetical protein
MGSFGNRLGSLTAPSVWRQVAVQSLEFAPWQSLVIFYVIFANIPYWIAADEFSFSHLGLFCAEYALVGLISLVAPRLLTTALLLFVICADILGGVCETYFLPVRVSIENFSAVNAFSFLHRVYAIGIVLLAVLTAWVAGALTGPSLTWPQRRKAALCLVAFAAFIIGTDVVSLRLATGRMPNTAGTGTNHSDQFATGASSVFRLARIPFVRLFRLDKIDSSIDAMADNARGPQSPMPSATGAAIRAAALFSGQDNRELPNLVLVMVESWGLAADAPLRQALVQPYLQPNVLARYEVIQGTAPFYGGTIAGEARELCGTSIGYYLIKAPAADLQGCLPTRLSALGYRPIALHGMSGFLFDRTTWYKTIGFREIRFHDEFKRDGLPDCPGPFPGTCDADIAAWIGRRLQQDGSHPDFIHWMTLNSHLPVLVPSPLSNGAPCEASLSLSQDLPLCSWYQLVANVHRSVADVAVESLARPTIFVIVGDHAPPFGDPRRRNRFSQAVVPYVVLVPRSIADNSKPVLAGSATPPASSHVAPSIQTP